MVEDLIASVDVAATGGWVLLASLAWLVVRSLVRGDLVTRREADAMQARLDQQGTENRDLREQNGLLLRDAVPMMNATLSTLRDLAHDRQM